VRDYRHHRRGLCRGGGDSEKPGAFSGKCTGRPTVSRGFNG